MIPKKVNKRFPGLERLLLASIDEIYRYLQTAIEADIEEHYPDVIEYLEFDNPDPDLILLPPSRAYQALADLLQLVAREEYLLEDEDMDDEQ